MNNYLQERLQPIANKAPEKSISKPVEIRLTPDAADGWQPTKSTPQTVADALCRFDASVKDCKKFVLQTHLNYTFYTNLCKPILGQDNFNNNDIT